jgi:hypothetical protein
MLNLEYVICNFSQSEDADSEFNGSRFCSQLNVEPGTLNRLPVIPLATCFKN